LKESLFNNFLISNSFVISKPNNLRNLALSKVFSLKVKERFEFCPAISSEKFLKTSNKTDFRSL
jgi:hypothetical protein